MFRLIKQVFIALLSFTRSLAIKCVSLNDEPCMTKPMLADLNPVELNYSFMISLEKFIGSFNVFDDLFMKMYVLSETKDVNVKVFNMITINEVKTLV